MGRDSGGKRGGGARVEGAVGSPTWAGVGACVCRRGCPGAGWRGMTAGGGVVWRARWGHPPGLVLGIVRVDGAALGQGGGA